MFAAPLGSDAVVIEIAGAPVIVIEYCWVEEAVAFARVIAKVEEPVTVGVPEIVVVAAVEEVFNLRPSGRLPDAMLHVKGPLAVVDAVSVVR